jgi:hypothetical protein
LAQKIIYGGNGMRYGARNVKTDVLTFRQANSVLNACVQPPDEQEYTELQLNLAELRDDEGIDIDCPLRNDKSLLVEVLEYLEVLANETINF